MVLATGQPRHAGALCDSALRLAKQIGDRYQQARAPDGLACASIGVADPAKARSSWQDALTIFTGLGAPEAGAIRAELVRLAATEISR